MREIHVSKAMGELVIKNLTVIQLAQLKVFKERSES